MRLLFAAASVKIVAGVLAASVIVWMPAEPAPALPTWYYLALLVVFELSGAWLFIGGRRDDRARWLATMLVLFATLFADRILLRAASVSPPAIAQVMVIIAAFELIAFTPYALWRFVVVFPRPQPVTRRPWVAPVMEYAMLATALVLAGGHLLAIAPGADRSGLASALAWTSQYDDRVFWQALTILSFACLAVLFIKWRRAASVERRRLSWVVFGIVLGDLPMLVHIVLAVSIPSYNAYTEQPEISRALGIIFTLFTLIIPLTTAYAVVEDQALDVSFVVRRAVQYALAKYTVLAAIAGLILAAALIAYGNRTRTMGEMIAESPIAVAVMLLLVVLLMSRRALLRAIDRRFFREHYDAHRILVNLTERSPSLHSARDVKTLLITEVQRALHLERVALLMLDDSGDTLADTQGRIRPLTLSGPLAAILSGSRTPLDVDLSSSSSALVRLPEAEREWLVDAGARLIVPLFGVRDTPLGVLVLGDKRSELPFTEEDKRLMTAVAAAAALALEQQLNRESPNVDTPASLPRSNGAQCGVCGRVQPRASARCTACNGPIREALLPIVLSGKFEVEQQIGAGGMGVVYRGRDLTLDRPVALKVLPRVGASAATRLRREARAMAALQHTNLALIHVLESWRGAPVLVLEYLAGGTLADRLRHRPLQVDEAFALFTAMTEVLQHIHQAGYLHRDIKPSNLGFTSQGIPKLLDFGLAQMIAEASASTATLSTAAVAEPAPVDAHAATIPNQTLSLSNPQFFGTPAYMSPEAVAMQRPDPLLDLWSLAVTMYESLAGSNPFRATSVAETVKLVKAAEVPDVRTVRRDCPAALAQFLALALARQPGQRPQTAAEFLSGLRGAQNLSAGQSLN